MTTQTTEAPPSAPSIETIKRLVAAEFGVSVEDIDGESRVVPLPIIRHAAMALTRELVPEAAASLPFIARAFKREHHGTVINAIHMIKERVATDKRFMARYALLRLRVRRALAKEAA